MKNLSIRWYKYHERKSTACRKALLMTTNFFKIRAVQHDIGIRDYETAKETLLEMWKNEEIDRLDFEREGKRLMPPLSIPRTKLVASTIPTIRLNDMEPRQFLLERFDLEVGNVACLCGSSNAGKTIFAQYIALCVRHNIPIFSQFSISHQDKPKRVLHIDYEQSEMQTQRRYLRLASFVKADMVGIDRIKMPFKLDTTEISTSEIKQQLLDLMTGYDLVIVDSLRQAIHCDENSSQVSGVLELLKSLAEQAKTVVLLIHHKGKNPNANSKDQGRGSSAIYAGCDIVIDLDCDEQTKHITLKCQKNRDQVYFPSLIYRLQDGGDFNANQRCTERLELILVDGLVRKDKKENQILELLVSNTEMNLNGLYDATGKGDKPKFYALLDDMVQQRLINERKGAKNARLFSIGDNGMAYLNYEVNDENKK